LSEAQRLSARLWSKSDKDQQMAAQENALRSVHMSNGLDARQWERFLVSRAGVLMAIRPGLSGMTSRACGLVDISRGGAAISVNTTLGLPDHYYLTIVGLPNRIGCAEVYRNANRVGVKFIKPIDDELLSIIVRGDFFTQ
jgi:hypothetical protein